MKYLQVEQGYDGTGTPFTLYNKTLVDETSSGFSDIK